MLFSFSCLYIAKTDSTFYRHDEVAEWLRRWTANPMGSARVGSNPILVVHFGLRVKFQIFLWQQNPKKGFRYRESNPGLLGESQLS